MLLLLVPLAHAIPVPDAPGPYPVPLPVSGPAAAGARLLDARKPMTAAEQLLPALDGPDEDGSVHFVLARCFYDLQMYGTAEGLFAGVVTRGHAAFGYTPALRNMVDIATAHDDFRVLGALVATVDPYEVQEPERSWLVWLRARELARDPAWPTPGKVPAEVDALGAIPLDHPAAIRARYLQGVLLHRAGKLKSAKAAFEDAVRAVATWRGHDVTRARAAELDASRDRAVLAIAAIYYEIERFGDARTWADLVRSPAVRPDADLLAMYAEFLDPTAAPEKERVPRTELEPPAAPDTPPALLARRAALADAPWWDRAEGDLLVALSDRNEQWCGTPGALGVAIADALSKRLAELPETSLARDPELRTMERAARSAREELELVRIQRDSWGAKTWVIATIEARRAEISAATEARRAEVLRRDAARADGLITQAEIWKGEQIACCLRKDGAY